MRVFYFFFTLIFIYGQISFSQEAELDHIIIAVSDLDSAIKSYEAKGFSVKRGTKHENGLENAFIKFQSGGFIELMSLYRSPTDQLAQKYDQLIKEDLSGAYLSLAIGSVDEAKKALSNNGIDYVLLEGKVWDYLILKDQLQHIFFIKYHVEHTTSTKDVIHENGCEGISEVFLDGGKKLEELIGLLKLNKTIRPTSHNVLLRPQIRSIKLNCPSKEIIIDL